ncbi:tyrosine-type recombinase/integrase [Celeribacter indicus]|uniref:Phage-related integrase n=1 Tax=Celeribacter indicus TaxID=1208324 RepID=A0A0B5DUU6_9RHOB|nr:site-specific integrase [Celeribacter indicus]AJE47168.1 phage-related integrase [Celeribacter indicus]SDV99998.1 Site-specific recombinase XerD [Celeribacter indicus]
MKLTAQSVAKIKPADKRQQISDDNCPGLNLIVQPSGKKGWAVRYRIGDTHRRMTLGAYPILSLAEARQRAREVFAAAAEGRDPAEEVRAAKASKPEDDRDKVSSLLTQYAKRHLKSLKSGATVKRELDRFVGAEWGDRDIHSITKRDVIDLLDEIADSGRTVTANRVRAYLSKFLNWCVERDILPMSPATGVKLVAKEKSRDRVLSDDEVCWFWQACDDLGFPWGPVGQVLLLTGQRLGEVVGMSDSELMGDLWHMDAGRTKNGRAHDVPLSKPVRDILAGVERTADEKGRVQFIFTTTGETPLSGFNKGRNHIAGRMAAIASKEAGEAVTIPHWTFHDLRRTAATGMARLGIAVRVTEAVLNHVSGTGGGIVAVYQRHDYADEKRRALGAWAGLVAEIVTGNVSSEKVVSIRGV